MSKKVWIISDTHFYHENIKRYENRPDNFNELLIANWNSKVGWDDLVIHLGDVIFGMNKDKHLPSIMAALSGRKILCIGNHDNFAPSFYYEAGFSAVMDYFVLNNVAFSHAPLTPLPPKVALNIHGHFHRGMHRGHGEAPPDRFYDYEIYAKNKSQYHLIQIEDELSPFLLEDISPNVFATRKK